MEAVQLRRITYLDPDRGTSIAVPSFDIPLRQPTIPNPPVVGKQPSVVQLEDEEPVCGVENKNNTVSNAVTLTWEHINVRTDTGGQKLNFTNKCKKAKGATQKHILKNVDGIAKPGEMLAIMGSSGSGKTTLFNVLNFRNKKKLKITGSIKINGVPIKSAKALSFISGYVEQDDSFIDTLTVKEHLTFHAMLRLGKNVARREREERVSTVISDLNLKKCENTLIGDAEKGIKGISTGEKRRLAVATELLRNINLLMADEPTSGLDSYMALGIIECLMNLARQGKTIICTIHQPSSEIFDKFDKLYLLAEGRVASLGTLNETAQFFRSQQLICPKSYNPSDFYIQKLAILPTEREYCLEKVNIICEAYRQSDKYREMIEDIDRSNSKSNLQKIMELADEAKEDYSSTSLQQISALFWRSSINTKRDKGSTYIRAAQVVFFGIMFGLIYFGQNKSQESIQNINGVLFMCLIESSFLSLMITTAVFCPEIPIILKEHTNGMYRIYNYFLAKIVTELPINIILPSVYISIIYWMANLNNGVDRFFICLAILVLSTNIAVAFGGLIAAYSRTVKVATQIASPLLVPLNVFAGYYLNRRTVPDYFIWMRYLSWIGYGNEALLINQWHGVKNIPCTITNNSTCLENGDQILASLEMDQSNFYLDIGVMIAIYCALRVLTYLMLIWRAHKQK